jgi:hypothetical protein
MKQPQRQRSQREPERGAVVIVIAFFLTILFAFAAFAVDIGFRYTKSRMLQAVADSAVSAGMPALMAGDANLAGNNAANMATANGYASTYPSTNITASTATGLLTVKVSASAPSFFAAIFGGGTSRLLSGTAVGAVTGTAGPALLALGDCGTYGLNIQGVGGIQINGAVESNGPLLFSTGGGTAPQAVTGTVESACSVNIVSGSMAYSAGPPFVGGPNPNPFSSVTLASLEPYCTGGTSTLTPLTISSGAWLDLGSGQFALPAGVYCSSTDINYNGIGTSIGGTGVTLISAQHVNIGANSTSALSTLSNAAGVPHNIAVYAGATDSGCSSSPTATNIGSHGLTITGSIYVPNGCAHLSGDNGMAVNGSVIGQGVEIGLNGQWTFNAPGGAGGATWRMQN